MSPEMIHTCSLFPTLHFTMCLEEGVPVLGAWGGSIKGETQSLDPTGQGQMNFTIKGRKNVSGKGEAAWAEPGSEVRLYNGREQYRMHFVMEMQLYMSKSTSIHLSEILQIVVLKLFPHVDKR